MDQKLTETAEAGDVTKLYEAIESDPFILDKIEGTPFTDTPIHIAAREGHTRFGLEIMMLKPSLAKKLNQKGESPMHLAIKNGNEQLVRGLFLMDKDLVHVKGKEGRTPLHSMVSTKGTASLIRETVDACPDSIKDLTVRRETALHIAVISNQYEAFDVLIEYIRSSCEEEIYRWQDDEGHTVLHQLTIFNRVEMLKLLFRTYQLVEWNLGMDIKDGNGQTALDIVEQLPKDHKHRDQIRKVLKAGGCRCARDIIGIKTRSKPQWLRYLHNLAHILPQLVREVPNDSRDALLVVLALVITATFEVGVNPPGGFWQEDGESNGVKHFAGTPILATTYPALYQLISSFNLAGFSTSVYMTILLTIEMPMRFLLLVALTFLSSSYMFAFITISRKQRLRVVLTTYGSVVLFVYIVIMFYLGRFLQPRKVAARRLQKKKCA
ncbi:hypothetical protein ACHQM5_018686 [Ranunculus cassubicifolius]